MPKIRGKEGEKKCPVCFHILASDFLMVVRWKRRKEMEQFQIL